MALIKNVRKMFDFQILFFGLLIIKYCGSRYKLRYLLRCFSGYFRTRNYFNTKFFIPKIREKFQIFNLTRSKLNICVPRPKNTSLDFGKHIHPLRYKRMVDFLRSTKDFFVARPLFPDDLWVSTIVFGGI